MEEVGCTEIFVGSLVAVRVGNGVLVAGKVFVTVEVAVFEGVAVLDGVNEGITNDVLVGIGVEEGL